MDEIINVWNEVRVTGDGISITLLSERASGGAIVEDETWFTFDELTANSPQSPISLNLSDETSQDFAEQRRLAHWSDDTRVEVVEVLPNTRCEEYVIQGRHEGQSLPKSEQSWTDETVATANPSYDEGDTVVRGKYVGSEKVYAFPASRLD